MIDSLREYELMLTQQQLFGRTALGLGTAAMANLFGEDLLAAEQSLFGRLWSSGFLSSDHQGKPLRSHL